MFSSIIRSPTHTHSSSPSLRSLALFLPGVTDLQQRLPAVLWGSGRGVGCAGRGRSAPRVQLLPLGGALSPHWWEQASMRERALTGHCADGLVWKDKQTKEADKQICPNTAPPSGAPHPHPPTLPSTLPNPGAPPVSLSLLLHVCFSPLLGDYWVQRCAAEQGGGGDGEAEEDIYYRHGAKTKADPLYTDYTLALVAHPWPWPQLLEQPHSVWH